MKYITQTTFILGFLLFGCYQAKSNTTSASDGKEQIQNLIRQVLNWSNSKNKIDVLPVLSDNKDSVYIGFSLEQHKENLAKLRETDLFTTEFIENYNQIILTLDKKLREKEFEEWHVGELPTFNFANDVDPWTLCQDIPNDNPNPWDIVEVKVIKLDKDKGELTWTWEKSEWSSDFGYKFRVKRENGRWKIDYMQGFDFKESTGKDEF